MYTSHKSLDLSLDKFLSSEHMHGTRTQIKNTSSTPQSHFSVPKYPNVTILLTFHTINEFYQVFFLPSYKQIIHMVCALFYLDPVIEQYVVSAIHPCKFVHWFYRCLRSYHTKMIMCSFSLLDGIPLQAYATFIIPFNAGEY